MGAGDRILGNWPDPGAQPVGLAHALPESTALLTANCHNFASAPVPEAGHAARDTVCSSSHPGQDTGTAPRPLRPASSALVGSTIPSRPRRRYAPGQGEAYHVARPPEEVCELILRGAREKSHTSYVSGQPT